MEDGKGEPAGGFRGCIRGALPGGAFPGNIDEVRAVPDVLICEWDVVLTAPVEKGCGGTKFGAGLVGGAGLYALTTPVEVIPTPG